MAERSGPVQDPSLRVINELNFLYLSGVKLPRKWQNIKNLVDGNRPRNEL